jgi:hypothetical protein
MSPHGRKKVGRRHEDPLTSRGRKVWSAWWLRDFRGTSTVLREEKSVFPQGSQQAGGVSGYCLPITSVGIQSVYQFLFRPARDWLHLIELHFRERDPESQLLDGWGEI